MRVIADSDLDDGHWFYDTEQGWYYQVETLDVDGDFVAVAGANPSGIDEDEDHPAETVVEFADRIDAGEIHPVPDDVVANPGLVVREFLTDELDNYLQTVGRDHPYNGLTHGETVGDIDAALYLLDRDRMLR